jgi:exodeoxyribonuclease V beta subunit
MRLLYVGVTRAIHQCQLGLSAMYYGRTDQPMFRHTPWAHLLRDQLDPDAAAGMPSWDELRSALQAKLAGVGHAVDYRVIGDAGAPDGASQETPEATPDPEPREPEEVTVRPSTWRVTSYSRLAHGHGIVLAERTDDDRERFADPAQAVAPEPPPESPTDGDQRWAQDIRYTLRGGVQTGNCLHDILEERALGPDRDLRAIIERQLPMRGLERPFRPRELDDAEYRHRVERYLPDLTNWLQSALEQPLGTAAGVPRLDTLLRPGRALPEMRFDFRLGREGEDAHYGAVDRVLEAHGHSTLLRRDSVSGLMTGAIDLLFIHEDRLYLADYKSNRLGAAPHFYDRPHLDAAMREQRYDLQYLIYTVAVDRHFRRRLGSRWAFDGGELSFGGVFYLFLRGMGLPGAYQDHGVWFARPEAKLVHALDSALGGEAWS